MCAEQRDAIWRWLAGSAVRLTRIAKLLARQGVWIAYPTLDCFAVPELQFRRTAPTIPVLDGDPRQELQVDTDRQTRGDQKIHVSALNGETYVFTATSLRGWRSQRSNPPFRTMLKTKHLLPYRLADTQTHIWHCREKCRDSFRVHMQLRGFTIAMSQNP